ncbi:MAG: DUF5362 family protein [Halobacteria archaeon]|nr:DUF5362 family protein [Halobacteria archaeon]
MAQSDTDVEGEIDYANGLKEAGLFFGGLALMFIGLLLSLMVVTAIIGIPMIVAGYAMYKSSAIKKQNETGMKIDYREE